MLSTSKLDLRLPALLIGIILSTVDSSALNLALPSLAIHFKTNAAAVQGAASCYMIGCALAFLPLSGLAGRVGSVKVYRGALISFSVISLLLAVSPNLPVLLSLRFLQGVAGAGIVGLIPGLAVATFEERKGWAMGMVSGAVAAGTLLGPPVGGFMVDHFGWRSIFFINLPFGVTAILLSGKLGELKGVGLRKSLRRAISAPRFLLALLASFLFYAQVFGTTLLMPFYLEAGGMAPSTVGLCMLIAPLMLLFIGPWAGRVSDRTGLNKVSKIGSTILALASWFQGITGSAVAGLFGIGFGQAFYHSANNAAVMAQAPENTGAVASGLLSIARVSGMAFGTVVAGGMWGALEYRGPRQAFLICNIVLGCFAMASGLLVLARKKPAPAVAETAVPEPQS